MPAPVSPAAGARPALLSGALAARAAGHSPATPRGGRRTPPPRPRAWANRRPATAGSPRSVLEAVTFDELPPGISEELGKCVARDAELVTQLGWEGFVEHHRPRGDLTDLRNVDHSAKHILKQYRDRGVPVRFSTGPWTTERLEAALARGAHPSCDKALEFLCEEFVDMVNKGQFVVLRPRLPRSSRASGCRRWGWCLRWGAGTVW